ncbi:hypothetical protein OEZ86_013779 [Tetradesmus obliquus]|nr:hypothetical protein OEZ86_013779 [Tetradesmus obliquus]
MMRVMLSNGATLQMPTSALKTRPYYAKQDLFQHNAWAVKDLFQHNAWAVKVAGMEAADSARMKRVDFSAFYNKFGGDGVGAEQQSQQQ